MTTKLRMIPLGQLTAWKGNVRKTGRKEGLDELCASIAAHGLLQALIVRKQEGGLYAVIAGERRLLALQTLAKKGLLATDVPVACSERTSDEDLTEVSLAENVVRVAMHPADQFEAFAKLAASGVSALQIAERFGVTEDTVAKRLKLGRLSPKILRAYRAGEIGLEQAQAFALTDDRKAQERVFESMPDYSRRPDAIRRALTEGEIPATDKRVMLVGLKAVADAGGAIRRDLFDAEDHGYVQDPALLDRLVSEKLATAAEAVKAEGWSWVSVAADFSYEEKSRFDRVFPDRVRLPKKKAALLRKLTAQYDNLAEKLEANEHDARAQAAIVKVQTRIEALEALTIKWPSKALSKAGAVITIAHDGSLEILRGLVRPEDKRVAKKAAQRGGKAAADDPAAGFPACLIADLTAQKSAAITVELARKPDIALAAVVHAMALHVHYRASFEPALKLVASPVFPETQIANPDQCPAIQAYAADCESWGDRLPGDPKALWSWCLVQNRDTLVDLLAHLAACTVDAVVREPDQASSSRVLHAQEIAQALSVDMTAWFSPTAENYFGRVSRTHIIDAYKQATTHDVAPAWLKLKKPELAERVAKALAPTGWLPVPVRIAPAANDSPAKALAEAAE